MHHFRDLNQRIKNDYITKMSGQVIHFTDKNESVACILLARLWLSRRTVTHRH